MSITLPHLHKFVNSNGMVICEGCGVPANGIPTTNTTRTWPTQ